MNTVLMEIVNFATTRESTQRVMAIEMPDVEAVGDLMDHLGMPDLQSDESD